MIRLVRSQNEHCTEAIVDNERMAQELELMGEDLLHWWEGEANGQANPRT